MSFKKFLCEVEKNNIFPTDEEIKNVAQKAEESFWKIVIENFKDRLEKTDLIFSSEKMKEFKEVQQEIIKEWLKYNWKELENNNENNNENIMVK